MFSGKISLYLLKLILNSDHGLTLSWQKQILTGLIITKIYQNRTMKISLFSYSMRDYISTTTSLPHIYRRNSCPTRIFKPTHQTGLSASCHPGIFQTNLPLLGTFGDSTTTSNLLYVILQETRFSYYKP